LSTFDDPGKSAARWLRWVEVLLAVLVFLMAATCEAEDQTLLLDVQINGHDIGKVGEFILRDGVLMARETDLHELGIRGTGALIRRNAASPDASSEGLLSLSDLPGLSWKIDQKTQTLYITASSDRLLPTILAPNEGGAPPARLSESSLGATLNYDVAGTLAGSKPGVYGLMDMRVFSSRGIASSGLLVHAGASPGGSGAAATVRLDSAYTFADVRTLRRYSLGDFITGGLAWTRPVRLTGAQIRSDFSMRPDLLTFPLPSVSGSAAVPSTVEVLADGNVIVSRPVDAGPFEIPQLPVVSGAGTISVTVTNALGQQVTTRQAFYATSTLLSPGLQTLSVQLGAVRLNWGQASNDYGKLAGTATYRRGLTRSLTVEGSAEGTPGTIMSGGGLVYGVGHLGSLSASMAASAGSGSAGGQFSLGGQRIGRAFSLGGSAIVASRNYRDVAAMNGEAAPRRQLNASTGFSLKRLGSAGAAYGVLDRDAAFGPVRSYSTQAQHVHLVSANYSFSLHRVSIYVTEFKDLAALNSSGFQVGVVIPFQRRSSADLSVASGVSGQLQVQQAAVSIHDWGYQAYVATGDITHEFAQLQYKSPWALVTAGLDQTGGQTAAQFETQGALSLADGGLFPSNTIYDSFGIVDTGPMTHVHVLQENRDVGETGSSGRLLVPDMRAFEVNHIAIEPTDIPADATIDLTSREVRPQDRSGVVIRFAVRYSHAALLRLVDEAGAPIALGSTATLLATGIAAPVGYEGEAYIQTLSLHNKVSVERPDGHTCDVSFDYLAVPGDIPVIGPLACVESKTGSRP